MSMTQYAPIEHSTAQHSSATVVPLRKDAYGRLVAVPRRERARRGDGDRLREEILEAAEYLLARYGHDDAVSIRAVANRVGCTPPAIYLHFEDKTQLLFEVCARRFNELTAAVDLAVESESDPLSKLMAGSKAYIAFGLANPEHYRILFMQKPILTPEQWRGLRASSTAGFNGLEQRCQALQTAGLMGNHNPTTVAIAVWQLSHGVVSLMIAKPSWGWNEVDDTTEHLMGAYLRGLNAEVPSGRVQEP